MDKSEIMAKLREARDICEELDRHVSARCGLHPASAYWCLAEASNLLNKTINALKISE